MHYMTIGVREAYKLFAIYPYIKVCTVPHVMVQFMTTGTKLNFHLPWILHAKY